MSLGLVSGRPGRHQRSAGRRHPTIARTRRGAHRHRFPSRRVPVHVPVASTAGLILAEWFLSLPTRDRMIPFSKVFGLPLRSTTFGAIMGINVARWWHSKRIGSLWRAVSISSARAASRGSAVAEVMICGDTIVLAADWSRWVTTIASCGRGGGLRRGWWARPFACRSRQSRRAPFITIMNYKIGSFVLTICLFIWYTRLKKAR